MTDTLNPTVALAPLVELVAEFDAQTSKIAADKAFLASCTAVIGRFPESGDITDNAALIEVLTTRLQIETLGPRIDRALRLLGEKESAVAAEAARISNEIADRLYMLRYGYAERAAKIMITAGVDLIAARWQGMKTPAVEAVMKRSDDFRAMISAATNTNKRSPGAALDLARFCIANLQSVLDEFEKIQEEIGGPIPSEQEMRKTA